MFPLHTFYATTKSKWNRRALKQPELSTYRAIKPGNKQCFQILALHHYSCYKLSLIKKTKRRSFFFSNKFERLGSNTGLRVKQRVWGVFHKGKTSYSYSLPRFPAEGIFNTWEIFFLASSNSVKTLKFEVNIKTSLGFECATGTASRMMHKIQKNLNPSWKWVLP